MACAPRLRATRVGARVGREGLDARPSFEDGLAQFVVRPRLSLGRRPRHADQLVAVGIT
jgi:hypothetical protein